VRRYHPETVGRFARLHGLKWSDLEDDEDLFGESPPAEVKAQFMEGWTQADDELLDDQVRELKETLRTVHLPEGKQGRQPPEDEEHEGEHSGGEPPAGGNGAAERTGLG